MSQVAKSASSLWARFLGDAVLELEDMVVGCSAPILAGVHGSLDSSLGISVDIRWRLARLDWRAGFAFRRRRKRTEGPVALDAMKLGIV